MLFIQKIMKTKMKKFLNLLFLILMLVIDVYTGWKS
jgi:hypothetical protein